MSQLGQKLIKAMDPLFDSGCVVLDGSCDCPRNPDGGVPLSCKYLKSEEKAQEQVREENIRPPQKG